MLRNKGAQLDIRSMRRRLDQICIALAPNLNSKLARKTCDSQLDLRAIEVCDPILRSAPIRFGADKGLRAAKALLTRSESSLVGSSRRQVDVDVDVVAGGGAAQR